jgi:hypothetical protein
MTIKFKNLNEKTVKDLFRKRKQQQQLKVKIKEKIRN